MPADSTKKTVDELRTIGNEKFRALNYGAALMCYTQAIDKDPQSYALYYNRAVTLVKMDAIDEAKEDLLRSLEINPDYIPSLCQLGFLHLYQGNTPDSLDCYVRVVRLSEQLPNQLSRFKAQLREAIRLAESRCRQQEYSDAFINDLITPDIRSVVDSYPNLPTHMVESGIPPIAFGNVPISQLPTHGTPIIASANIPIPMTGIRVGAPTSGGVASTAAPEPTPTDLGASMTMQTPGSSDEFASRLNLPGLFSAFGQPIQSASFTVGPGQNGVSDIIGAINNITHPQSGTSNAIFTPAAPTTGTSNANASTPTIIHPPITRATIHASTGQNTTTGLPIDLLQAHREAHNAALNRAAELRRQREAQEAPATAIATSNESTASTSAPVHSSDTTTETTSTAPSGPAAVTAPSPGSDFARQLANTIATQLSNAAATPNDTAGANPSAIRSLTQNLTSIASGVLGGIVNGNGNANNHDDNNSNGGGSANSTGSEQLDSNLVDDLD